MIDSLGTFFSRHVRKQVRRILQTSHPYLAGCLAVVISFNYYGFGEHFSIDQNLSLFENYDTVVFGFTATAMAITLTVSSSSFLRFISSHEIDGRTAFRTGAFVLAWNSLTHSVAFMAVFIAKNSLLWQSEMWAAKLATEQRLALWAVLWLQFYAFFQFIVTNLTLFELSDLFGIFLQKTRPDRDG